MTMPMAPSPLQIDLLARVQTEILNTQSVRGKEMIHARTTFETLRPDAAPKAPDAQVGGQDDPPADASKKTIEYTIQTDGQVADVKGYDTLDSGEREAWGEWISLFAMAAAFPEKRVKRGEKWGTEDAERSPAPIAGLTWVRKSTYAEDESCGRLETGDLRRDTTAGKAQEMCAVILTHATLRQESPRKDSTPDDFRLHQLRTKGTAGGTSQVIAYISLKTGLVVRATEESSQSMDVTLEKTDESNQVHYKVKAKSSAEMLLVSNSPASER